MSSNDEALETEQINKDEKEEILSPSDVEKVFASQGMQVKVIDSGTIPAGDGRESPKKRARKDVDEDELTECCHCAKTFNIAYIISTSADEKDLCVSCVIKEALQFASERGYSPGCTVPGYEAGGARLHYALDKISSCFNEGWAEFSNGN